MDPVKTCGPLRVLHIEDDYADSMLVQSAVCEAEDYGIEFEVARTLKDARRKLGQSRYDLVLIDLFLPDSRAPAATVSAVREAAGATPLMVLSGAPCLTGDRLPRDIPCLDKSVDAIAGQARQPLAELLRKAAQLKPKPAAQSAAQSAAQGAANDAAADEDVVFL